jgi:hypothetical protein
MRRESKVHRLAKARLARWLREMRADGKRWLRGCKVRVECPYDPSFLWHDDPRYARRTPSTRELWKNGIYCPVRFDVAVTAPGRYVAGFEVLKSHPVPREKGLILHRATFPILELSSLWIMEHRDPPDDWREGITQRWGSSAVRGL